MSPRSALAVLIAAACLGACTPATPAGTTVPVPAADQTGTPAGVLDQARDVAEDLEQREADLESLVP